MHPLRALQHSLREARDGLWRNRALGILAVASIGVSLYVFGLVMLVVCNLDRFVEALGRDTQLQVYLREDASDRERQTLRARLRVDPAVASFVYVDAAEARRRFDQTFPGLRDLSERISGDPFPASFELSLREADRHAAAIERLAASYRDAAGVEEVRYDLAWVERLSGIVALVRRGGYGLGGLMALAVMVTAGAVVRLTVLARREEIAIMKLVGATASFIRGPFLLAATFQGLAGGGLAVALLFLTHRMVLRSAIYASNPFMVVVTGRFLPAGMATLLALGGAVLGLFAAALALRHAGAYPAAPRD